MATKQTLASLLGSSDKRQQVELGLGQQALQPGARAGNYQVAVQQTLGASQTTAGKLANALQGVSPVLRQYTDFTYQQGVNTAAAVLPQDAEAELKKMEPNTWLNIARQRGLREGLIKKQLNENVIPGIKRDIQQFLDYKKYPSPQKAEEAFNNYNADKWAEYSASLPEGIGDSLEAKVMWSSLMSTTKNGLLESYNSGLDKFNLSNNSAETQQKWNVLTTRDETGAVDYGTAIQDTVDTMNLLGEKAGIASQDTLERLRVDMVRRADTLEQEGNYKDAQELIRSLRRYRRNGQPIFTDAATAQALSRIEGRVIQASQTAANRSRQDVDRENTLNAKRIETQVLNLNEGTYALDHPDLPKIISSFTTAPVEEVLEDIKARADTGISNGDALFESLKVFNAKQSTEEQRDSFTLVQDSAQDGITRHYATTPRLLKLEAAQEANSLSTYAQALYSGQTGKGPQAYFNENQIRLNPEQLVKAKRIYDTAVVYNTNRAANEETDNLFKTNIKGLEGADTNTVNSFVDSIMINEVDPLRRQRAELIVSGVAEDDEQIINIDKEISDIMTQAKSGYLFYQEQVNEFKELDSIRGAATTDVIGKKVARVGQGGQSQNLKTIQRNRPRTVTAAVQSAWTEEEIQDDRRTALRLGGSEALEYSIHNYPFQLDAVNQEDFIEKVDMLGEAGVDLTDKLMFANQSDAYDAVMNAYNAAMDLLRGRLDLSDPMSKAYLKLAQDNGIKTESDAEDMLTIIEQQLKNL